jgi:hypothetical protein
VPGAVGVVAGVVGAGVVAVAEPDAPAEPAELVRVAGAGAAVLPQPQATTVVITAMVNKAVVRKW